MSLSVSAQSLTIDKPEVGLEFPKPLETKINNQVMLAFTIEDYGMLLKIFAGYRLWEQQHPLELKLQQNYEERIQVCNDRLEIKDDTLTILKDDRNHVYNLLEDEQDKAESAENKGTIKAILTGLGTGVVGIALGILIGVLAL